MTQQSRKQLEYTLATHAVEKLAPSDAAIRLCEQVSEGTLTADRAVLSILEQYGLKGSDHNG